MADPQFTERTQTKGSVFTTFASEEDMVEILFICRGRRGWDGETRLGRLQLRHARAGSFSRINFLLLNLYVRFCLYLITFLVVCILDSYSKLDGLLT